MACGERRLFRRLQARWSRGGLFGGEGRAGARARLGVEYGAVLVGGGGMERQWTEGQGWPK